MTYVPLPHEIMQEVIRQQDKMGWPKMVPTYAEMPHPDGETRFKAHEDLTPGDCEQIVEWRTRLARKAIMRWSISQTTRSLRAAGKNILYARLYRCTYISLIGQESSAEVADMPFPFATEDEMRASEGNQ